MFCLPLGLLAERITHECVRAGVILLVDYIVVLKCINVHIIHFMGKYVCSGGECILGH